MGGKTPGKLHEARTASRTSPSRSTTGSPVSTSVATTTTGTRRPSNVATGRNSSIIMPSRVPESRPPPQPRTHVQGCRREACSTSCSRSAPPAQAAATSAPPLTPRSRRPPSLPVERAQDPGVGGGVAAPAGQREVELLHARAGGGGVDLLQAQEVERALAEGADRLHGGGGGGQGRHHEHAVQGGALADGPVVVERLAAEGGVEDDRDLAVLDEVHHVGPALVHLVDELALAPRARSGTPAVPRVARIRKPISRSAFAWGRTPGLSKSFTLMKTVPEPGMR